MEYRTRENLIDRILIGFSFFIYNNQKLKIYSPDRFNYHRAELYREQIYEENKYDDWLDNTQIELLLFRLNQLPIDYKEKIKQNRVRIDDLKVQIYKQKFSESKREFLRRNIRNLEKTISRYEGRLNYFLPLTLDGYTNLYKSDYIIYETVLDEDDNYVVEDSYKFEDFSNLVRFINNNDLDIDSYRELARTEPWRSYWCCNKENPFNISIPKWTEQQRNLVIFSRMYDSVFESSECPTDDIIHDNDRLDGWFIFQNKKAKKSREESENEKVLGSSHNQSFNKSRSQADEVYLMANSKEEVEHIHNLNDETSKMIKKQRNDLIKQKGKVKEYQLPDRQRQIEMQTREKFRQFVKGNKK